MTAPANDLALVAEARRWAREFPGQVTHNDREREICRITADLILRLADRLAPTLDALAAAETREAAQHDAMLRYRAEMEHQAQLAAKAEADCAALRLALEDIKRGPLQEPQTFSSYAGTVATNALQATDAGQPLLDELARLRECVGVRGDSQTADFDRIEYTRLRTKLEAAESALRLAKEDGERLDWLAAHDKAELDAGSFRLKLYCFGKYFRQAIDAARQKLPEVGKA